jgi:hypothetical protein
VHQVFDHGDALPEAHYRAADDPCQTLMKTVMSQLLLPAQAYHRVLKL